MLTYEYKFIEERVHELKNTTSVNNDGTRRQKILSNARAKIERGGDISIWFDEKNKDIGISFSGYRSDRKIVGEIDIDLDNEFLFSYDADMDFIQFCEIGKSILTATVKIKKFSKKIVNK